MSSLSKKNVKEAFAGESQASQRYLAFARKAEAEGKPNAARLFRAIAYSESIHAYNHLNDVGGIGSTEENLEEAWKGEKDEYSSMYPMFMDQARRDADNDALKTLFWANEAEKAHGDFYAKALEAVRGGGDAEVGDLYVCELCGYTVEGEPPEKCPVCGEPHDRFRADGNRTGNTPRVRA